MLGKLLKYELKELYKILSIFYILTIFFAVLTRILFSLPESTIVNILGQISVGCLFAMFANVIINTLMRNWVRFRETLYKDESYLTHTLPIDKKTLFNSKFIASILTLLSSIIIIVLGVVITYYSKERLTMLKDALTSIGFNLDVNIGLLITLLIAIFYLEIYNAISSGFLGIVIGHKKSTNQVGKSVLWGFITYITTQLFCLLSVFIYALFDKEVMNVFTSTNINGSLTTKLCIFCFFVYLIVVLIVKLITRKELEKGVNVL